MIKTGIPVRDGERLGGLLVRGYRSNSLDVGPAVLFNYLETERWSTSMAVEFGDD